MMVDSETCSTACHMMFREKVDGEGQKRGFILLQPLDLGTNQPYETNLDC